MYTECITCQKIGISCDGPNFVAMSAQELLTWCKARKAHLHLTNGRLAELSGMPKGTIDRLFAGDHVDFRYETIRPLIKALAGGDWSGNPCPDPGEDIDAALDDLRKQHAAEIAWRDDKIKHFTEENDRLRNHFEKENGHLMEENKRKNRYIAVLGVLAIVALLYIIVTLIIDVTDPSRGYYWLEGLLHLPQSFMEQGGQVG